MYYLNTISRKQLSLCFRQRLLYAISSQKTLQPFLFYWRNGWFITSTVGAIQTTPHKVVGEDTPQHVGSLRQTQLSAPSVTRGSAARPVVKHCGILHRYIPRHDVGVKRSTISASMWPVYKPFQRPYRHSS